MNTLKVSFENCFGITKFVEEFDFSKKRVHVIYAPNGTMKTSFANTFECLSRDIKPCDRIHTERVSSCEVFDDGAPINKDKIFVIVPMNQDFQSGRLSTLLANSTLKAEYSVIRGTIDEKKEALINALRKQSGLTKNMVEETLAYDIANDPNGFIDALGRKRDAVKAAKKSSLVTIQYATIFNDKVQKLLDAPDFQTKLTDYMRVYEELIRGSRFFHKGIFNHDNADNIAKNLADNGFFAAQHSINMKVKKEEAVKVIQTQDDLVKVIKEELEAIKKDKNLEKAFTAINNLLKKSDDVFEFRRLIEQRPDILEELKNRRLLKDKLWTDYLINVSEQYSEFMEVYDHSKDKIADIFRRAREEKTKWLSVIEEFNRRFAVPFTVFIKNQEDVILNEEAPTTGFNHTGKTIEKKELWDVLSMGERRALYLLNIIFEVQGRLEENRETLFIIDDVADSFDYKNKYAIIEYLADMASQDKFLLIILTHNFDFYRTVTKRLEVKDAKYFIEKTNDYVRLVQDPYWKSPFLTWKGKLQSNDTMLVASIPFVRNLAEYCGGDKTTIDKLTAFLHYKPNTDSLTVGDLDGLFKSILKDIGDLQRQERKVKDLTYALADSIASSKTEYVHLEHKIILAMAIRLKAEEFMIRKINDNKFWQEISKCQTIKLIRRYKDKFGSMPDEEKSIRTLESVNLMTPENIHINSFMYEPILDMSNDNLADLYTNICSLK